MDFNKAEYSDPLRAGDGGSLISSYNRSREYTSYDYDQKLRDSFINITDAFDNDSFGSFHTANTHNSSSDDSDSITSCNTMICHSTAAEESDSQSISSYDTMVCHSTGDEHSIGSCATMVCYSSPAGSDKGSLLSYNSVAILSDEEGSTSEDETWVNYDAAVSLNTTLDEEDLCGIEEAIELMNLKPIKQVCFSETPVEIEPSVTWSDEELLAGREGPWVDIAFANYEFRCRIEEEFESLLSPVLKKAHIKIVNSRRVPEDQHYSPMESILV